MKKPISWFEIPTTELGRAVTFYETMLGTALRPHTGPGPEMAIFPYEMGYTGGALVRDPQRTPGPGGTLIYLSCDTLPGGLDGCIARAGGAGGTVLMPRTAIGPNGFIAVVKDSEGNVVGLHVEP